MRWCLTVQYVPSTYFMPVPNRTSTELATWSPLATTQLTFATQCSGAAAFAAITLSAPMIRSLNAGHSITMSSAMMARSASHSRASTSPQ